MKIYFAADHAGVDLKARLMAFVHTLATAGKPYDMEDCGAHEYDAADDYPDFVGRAGKQLSEDAQKGIESRAVVIGASGQGEAIAMNRFKGVRCALYYGEPSRTQKDMSGKELDMLASTREHNNVNALSFGARFLSEEEAEEALKKWLSYDFSGESRHLRRIQKLDTFF